MSIHALPIVATVVSAVLVFTWVGHCLWESLRDRRRLYGESLIDEIRKVTNR